MNKYKLIALATVFLAFQKIPAQVATFTSETKLVIVNVTVKDKSGKPITNLKKEDFEVMEDNKKQDVAVFELEKLNNDRLPPAQVADNSPKQLEERVAPTPKAAAPTAASTSTSVGASQRKDRRLLAMFFDMTTMPQFDQIRAQENAIKFIKEQMTSSDLVEIMTYGNKLKVVEEFTDDREKLLSDLKNLVLGEGADLADAADTSSAEGDDSGGFTQDDSEFNIFNTDRKLAAIEDAVKKLAPFPEKKAMIYFSSGVSKSGIDNQSQLKATVNAAVRANVAIYSVDARGLQASAPAGDAATAVKGTGAFSGSAQSGRRNSLNDSQETITTLAADTGGKALLDNNDLTVGIQQAQEDLTSYYILGYYSTNSAEDGKYRRISVRLTNAQLASNTKPLDYKSGYYASKVFQKFTSSDKEAQLQEALTLGDPLGDLPLALEVDYFRVANNRYFVPVSVKIPGSEIALAKRGGAETTDFDFVGVVHDAAGKALPNTLPNWATTGVRDAIKVQLKGTDAGQLEKRNLQYDTGLTLPPGSYSIRFLARENQTGKMGTFETKFTIPDLATEKSLKLSSVIWSSQKEAVASAIGSASNDKRATSNHPLIENGQKIVPSITNVFRKDQMMYVHFEVYDPGLDADKKTTNLAAQVDLFRGARKVYSSPPQQVSKLGANRQSFSAFDFTIPLASLPAGRYTAQVNVIDENGRKFGFARNPIILLPVETADNKPAAQ
ncbi:MAG TPA: VWA domain-containing protein [Bryobacteraceae bacterium]|jgi:VWFA-related protein